MYILARIGMEKAILATSPSTKNAVNSDSCYLGFRAHSLTATFGSLPSVLCLESARQLPEDGTAKPLKQQQAVDGRELPWAKAVPYEPRAGRPCPAFGPLPK